jgi:hypothetical protein
MEPSAGGVATGSGIVFVAACDCCDCSVSFLVVVPIPSKSRTMVGALFALHI